MCLPRKGLRLLRKSMVLSLLLALPGLSARAENPAALTGDELRRMVPGSSIEIDTPLSTVVPIHFTADGLMTGEAGTLASVFGAERDRGRWWITGDRLCLKWFRWFDAEQRCLELSQDGERVFWQADDGKTGTATVTKRGQQIAALGPGKSAPADVAAKPTPPPVVAAAAVPPPAPPPVPTPPPVMASTDFGPLLIISRAEAATPPAAQPDAADAPQPAAPSAVAKSPKPKSIARKSLPASKSAATTKSADAKSTRPSAKIPSKAAATAKQHEPLYEVAGVEEDDVLNIRNGPSEYHDAIGAIPPSARGVKIVGACEADWCPVTHGSTKGWVNRYYLAPEAAQSARAAR